MPERRLRAAALAAVLCLAALSTAASAERTVGPVSSLGPIGKEHNVRGVDNLLYLRMRIPATIRAQKGADVALSVWFADDGGTLIPALMREYADASGLLKVESVTFRVAYETAEREFVLALPYNAFPRRRDKEAKYFVEARARLVRRSEPQAVIASATTTFWVEQ
jgi:hypothetical protein